jgi:tRNA (guanine37-N1)-methyltransferase
MGIYFSWRCFFLRDVSMARRLKDILATVLTAEERQNLIGGFDVVGDIAIIIIPEALVVREQVIAAAILANNSRIRVVAKRAGLYGGEFRTIPLCILAGENRTVTEVREFGLRLRLNAERVYYSVRSGNERRRIASLVAPGESVLVLFSGVAPYPLIISQFSKARRIVGIEKNPESHEYALQNLQLNKKLKNITLHLGDAATVIAEWAERFDRVIMPLPTMAENFLPATLRVLKAGGTLHFYDLQRPDGFTDSVGKIIAACSACSRKVLSSEIIRCGHCGPQTFRICVDARIQ